MSRPGHVLVYGGRGALGRTLVTFFKSKNYRIVSVDLMANEEADENLLVDPNATWTQQEESVIEDVQRAGFGVYVFLTGVWY